MCWPLIHNCPKSNASRPFFARVLILLVLLSGHRKAVGDMKVRRLTRTLYWLATDTAPIAHTALEWF
ncbi:hypothetical protein [Paraburkholderia sp. UYCP14C]|uniref:hypothetical protein n=1 Tax=Paraburkholderia sp. UYCP14C TaxID=2511130 RepID=UPI001459FC3C|nr:hypothetical protein [Paraburkholderia sp. UYCP14C]